MKLLKARSRSLCKLPRLLLNAFHRVPLMLLGWGLMAGTLIGCRDRGPSRPPKGTLLRVERLESRRYLTGALLDDFSSARLNGDGTALWAPYLGEDPSQSGRIVAEEYQLNVGAPP